ncbi:AraC family transcriptional regulator [Lacisediminihabitans changchengi]|uniref:AraC family transcriptional regulator n=1 Tax=Lacisediminihabitans changchengi TaxID=2787634 RepID=A0A934W3E4_9MICO|nr:AraC family transcriptional regulator [Lacisediminihabitans changchengi]MBK4347119.1 AraC family transcriptional regulator [Lacisediminihabitans changchengi]
MSIAEGFPGQRLLVLPRPRISEALDSPGTTHLLVTDCGYFPEARAHRISRSTPVSQAVVLVCTAGGGWCRIGEITHPVAAGQAVVIPPGVAHSYGSNRDDPWTLWFVHLDGRGLDDVLTACGMTELAPVRTVVDTFRVVALMEEIVSTMERDLSTSSLLAASGAAWHMLTLLAALQGSDDHRIRVIEDARDFLRGHFTERVSIASLAAKAQLSPSHFSALFRRQVGFPVLQYQTQLRMSRARELLDTTDLSVASIAVQVGYDDAFYFSRQFKSVHGTTALRYRALHKG